MQLALHNQQSQEEREPLRIRVPFLQEPTGLGDAIAQATSAVGIRPCGGCKERAQNLNRRIVLSPWEA